MTLPSSKGVARTEPRVHWVPANGLVHHVLEWQVDPGAPERVAPRSEAASRQVVLLLHGFTDAAASWDRVAERVVARGRRVLAPDFRGFGEGPRVPAGGYYHFPDYVADLSALVARLVAPEEKLAVVGHSMGGTVATYFTGALPERVSHLAVLEGVGPPDNPFEVGPDRMRRWLEDLRRFEERDGDAREAVLASEDDALRRLRHAHPGVPEEVLQSRIPYLTKVNDQGALVWRYDVLHRTTSPFPFFAATYRAFASRVTCPVLFVSGGPAGYHAPDEAERVAAFRHVRTVEIADAGHMIHWTRPEELAHALVEHLG